MYLPVSPHQSALASVVSTPSTVCLTPSLSLSGEFFPDLARAWEAQSAGASGASPQPSPLMAVLAVGVDGVFPCSSCEASVGASGKVRDAQSAGLRAQTPGLVC